MLKLFKTAFADDLLLSLADLSEALKRSPGPSTPLSGTPRSGTPRSDRAEGPTPSKSQQPLTTFSSRGTPFGDDGQESGVGSRGADSSGYTTAGGKAKLQQAQAISLLLHKTTSVFTTFIAPADVYSLCSVLLRKFRTTNKTRISSMTVEDFISKKM